MIYLKLNGRIGNQLFMYAAAKSIKNRRGNNEKIFIDDTSVLKMNWKNSLKDYKLDDVEYINYDDKMVVREFLFKQNVYNFFFNFFNRFRLYRLRYNVEKRLNSFFARKGMIVFENGYCDLTIPTTKNIYVQGYFQSEKYFSNVSDEVKRIFSFIDNNQLASYPSFDKIVNSNSVCVSIKVEHNVGSSVYDVCGKDYWEKAIEYIVNNVDNPLFFICSDNVDYVLENIIDTNKFNCIVQSKNSPVHISLAMMSRCKHFIIGNTSYGWWAQYLSNYKDKIVVAPSKWYNVDIPCDIYQTNWKVIEV